MAEKNWGCLGSFHPTCRGDSYNFMTPFIAGDRAHLVGMDRNRKKGRRWRDVCFSFEIWKPLGTRWCQRFFRCSPGIGEDELVWQIFCKWVGQPPRKDIQPSGKVIVVVASAFPRSPWLERECHCGNFLVDFIMSCKLLSRRPSVEQVVWRWRWVPDWHGLFVDSMVQHFGWMTQPYMHELARGIVPCLRIWRVATQPKKTPASVKNDWCVGFAAEHVWEWIVSSCFGEPKQSRSWSCANELSLKTRAWPQIFKLCASLPYLHPVDVVSGGRLQFCRFGCVFFPMMDSRYVNFYLSKWSIWVGDRDGFWK